MTKQERSITEATDPQETLATALLQDKYTDYSLEEKISGAINMETSETTSSPIPEEDNDEDEEEKTEIIQAFEVLLKNIKSYTGHFPDKRGQLLSCVCNIIELTAKCNDIHIVDTHLGLYIYSGKYWQLVDRRTAQKYFGELAGSIGLNPLIAKNYKFREELLKQAEETFFKEIPKINPNRIRINLNNGIFDFKTKKILPHNPNAFYRYVLSFEYDPDAECPMWMRFLEEVMPDESARKVLQEFVGYIFTHRLKLEKFLLLYGGGSNGKSVFLEVIKALLGSENITNFSLANLCKEESKYTPLLSGKLANLCAEISAKKIEDSGMMKAMISGEPITGRPLYRDPVTIEDYGKLIFAMNNLPETDDRSIGFYRRFLIIKFGVQIKEENQDKKLPQRIIENELPGILNWALVGLERILENEAFTVCKSADDELKKYQTDNDNVALFVEDKKLVSDNNEKLITFKELYDEYKAYAIEGGYKSCNKNNFRKRLESLGIYCEKGTGNTLYVLCRKEPDIILPF